MCVVWTVHVVQIVFERVHQYVVDGLFLVVWRGGSDDDVESGVRAGAPASRRCQAVGIHHSLSLGQRCVARVAFAHTISHRSLCLAQTPLTLNSTPPTLWQPLWASQSAFGTF